MDQSQWLVIMVMFACLEDILTMMVLQRCALVVSGQMSVIAVYQTEQLLLGFFADNSLDNSHVRWSCIWAYNHALESIHSGFFTSSCCKRQANAGNVTLYNIICNDRSRGFAQDCTYNLVMEYNTAPASGCTLQNELIIGCYERSSCVNGDLRLRGGNSTHQGRVELCNQGLWGIISSTDYFFRYEWDSRSRNAMVVCRQLGYPWECKVLILHMHTHFICVFLNYRGYFSGT